MSSAPRYRPHYTVDDYARWEGDWELWDGVPISMSPSPFGRHSQLVVRLATQMENSTEKQQCDASVLAEIDWIVSRDTVVRPDVSVVCGPAPEKHIDQCPALVAEVLSAGTRDRDLREKKDLYQEQAVGWYLAIDPNDDLLHAWRLHDGRYENVPTSDSLQIDVCENCTLTIDVPRMFR